MYPKATHYCHAALFGENHHYQSSSDDKEPARTAGIPILEVLKRFNVTNILCVVVRYYGGIKLGSGGLIRAYSKASQMVLNHAEFYEQKMMKGFQLTFDYAFVSKIDHILKDDAIIYDKIYDVDVTYCVYFKSKGFDLLNDVKHQLKKIIPLEDKILWIKAK